LIQGCVDDEAWHQHQVLPTCGKSTGRLVEPCNEKHELPCFLSSVPEGGADRNRSKANEAQMTARWREDYVFVIFVHGESAA
jgi:hypothetical protein